MVFFWKSGAEHDAGFSSRSVVVSFPVRKMPFRYMYVMHIMYISIVYGTVDFSEILHLARWWFHFLLIFTPDPWGNDPIWLLHIFQTGWLKPPTSWDVKKKPCKQWGFQLPTSTHLGVVATPGAVQQLGESRSFTWRTSSDSLPKRLQQRGTKCGCGGEPQPKKSVFKIKPCDKKKLNWWNHWHVFFFLYFFFF